MEDAQLKLILESLKELKDEVKSIKKLLNGNGEIGLLEAHRDLEQKFTSVSVRVRAIEEDVKPLKECAFKKDTLKEFAKQAGVVLATMSPIIIPALIWMIKIWEKLNQLVPLDTIIRK